MGIPPVEDMMDRYFQDPEERERVTRMSEAMEDREAALRRAMERVAAQDWEGALPPLRVLADCEWGDMRLCLADVLVLLGCHDRARRWYAAEAADGCLRAPEALVALNTQGKVDPGPVRSRLLERAHDWLRTHPAP